MLTVDEARRRVLDAVDVLPTESVSVDAAYGRVLATDLVAPHPLPRFANSAMDGYALRASDVVSAPTTLRLTGEVRAGDPGEIEVLPGTAVRIMTGAPLPPGADAVIPVEETEESDDEVTFEATASTGQHVRPAGDDLAQGDVVAKAGSELGAGELALLASLGFSPVTVFGVPKVAVLVTGDELIDPEEEPKPGQIRDSNSVALSALVADAGAEVVVRERVEDEEGAVVESFERAAKESDVVVSSGGVAVGKYDYVKAAIERLGHIDLWRVAMQPGKPVVLGSIGETPFLGLPGNPVSIHIGFEQFVRPAIRKMRGCSELVRPTITATLTETITKRPGRLHFVRVRLSLQGDGFNAIPTGPQGSHIQSSLIGCHGVARFPIDDTEIQAGSPVTVEVWSLPGVTP